MRLFKDYPSPGIPILQNSLPALAGELKHFCLLDSNEKKGDSYALLAGIDSVASTGIHSENNFETLSLFLREKHDWIFGHFAYDLKNEMEALHSEHPDGIGFPALFFFQPRFVLLARENTLSIGFLAGDETASDALYEKLIRGYVEKSEASSCAIEARVSENDYLLAVESLRRHIARGDIYEINYCIEFFARNCLLAPGQLYQKLQQLSQAPFSALYRLDAQWLLCASPERFLQKKGSRLLSQPIKGTARRGKTPEEDALIRTQLRNDPKEQSENVMIVDLVRNDLSRVAKKGSVNVDELFGIYSFSQVHQMISSVSAELRDDCSGVDAIRCAFPMGSMTGAPKVRAMQLIEDYEATKRGLYSGAVGYFTPEGDFDFNVVIRSIQYNAAQQYLSFMVGSAITHRSDPAKEYEECLLKAKAMFEVLGS